MVRKTRFRGTAPTGAPEAERGRGDRGNALVELALLLPLLTSLVFGMLSGGLLMNRRESINHAVREGARYGATVDQYQCIPTSNCGGLTWAQLVQSIVVARSDGALTTSQVCVALVNGSGANSTTPPSAIDTTHTTAGSKNGCYVDNSADTGFRVQVTGAAPDQLDAILLKMSVTLSSKATMQFES